ncbi:MAG: hypothetical protein COA95_06160 [Methylophaga sp.]|nr:MAG: hypothetical protein COA95_06160 [Methylophaga sp.]
MIQTELSAPLDFLLQHHVEEITAPAGTIIASPGDICQNLIVLLEGQVRIYRPAEDGRSITLYNVGKGESCTLTASCILNTTAFPAIAKVEKDAKGFVISAKQVQKWLKTEPIWQNYMFSLLSQRIVALISLVDALAFQNLDVRLAYWLLDHSQSQSIINTTHQRIADDLASSREVISRLLKEFEVNGCLNLARGYVELINREKLSHLTLM